jgi:hypothetical protein
MGDSHRVRDDQPREVLWVLASAANDNPAVEKEVNEQVRKMLLCRRLYNRKKKSGKPNASIVELTTAELRIAIDNGDLSHTWFMHFYAVNPQCQMKMAHRQEARRVGKQREPTVERHFFGEFGLKVHLTARARYTPFSGTLLVGRICIIFVHSCWLAPPLASACCVLITSRRWKVAVAPLFLATPAAGP